MRQPPADVVAAAQAAERATGVLACVSLGQWALESAWGARCTGRFNFFGIKALAGQPATLCWTHEFVGGQSIPAQQPFADFPSLESGFLAHARLLCGERYAAAGPLKDNVAAFVHAIGPIYATNPQYADDLLALIREEGLQRYDLPPDDFGAAVTRQALAP